MNINEIKQKLDKINVEYIDRDDYLVIPIFNLELLYLLRSTHIQYNNWTYVLKKDSIEVRKATYCNRCGNTKIINQIDYENNARAYIDKEVCNSDIAKIVREEYDPEYERIFRVTGAGLFTICPGYKEKI